MPDELSVASKIPCRCNAKCTANVLLNVPNLLVACLGSESKPHTESAPESTHTWSSIFQSPTRLIRTFHMRPVACTRPGRLTCPLCIPLTLDRPQSPGHMVGHLLSPATPDFKGLTICSGNAPISTGACPGIVESRTVLILCRYEVYSHLRPSYSHHFFRNRGSAPRGTVTTFGSQ